MVERVRPSHSSAGPATVPQSETSSKEAWAEWVERSYGADPRVARAAIDAVQAELAAGATADEAAAAARAAAEDEAAIEARETWGGWAMQSFGGDPARAQAATDAAIAAIAAGASTDDAAAAAMAAAGASTRGGSGSPPVSDSPSRREAGSAARAVRGALRGRVTGLQVRYETYGRRQLQVWDFRVDRMDGQPPVAAEMRGYSFEGGLNEGDDIQIRGDVRPGRVVPVRSVENLTTNSTVRVHGHPPSRPVRFALRSIRLLFLLVFFAIFLAVIVVIVLVATNHGHF